jgi:hypothetical protein
MTHTDRPAPWIRAVVLLNALFFVDFGAGFLVFPEPLAALVDLAPKSPTGLADLRAMYGGLCLAAGVTFFLGLRRADWFAPVLFLVMATSLGLALARAYSTVVSGLPGGAVLASFALEIVSFAWAALAYRALGSGGVSAPLASPASA